MSRSLLAALPILGAAALAAPASSQAYVPGDVYVHGLQQGSLGGVLARVDRATGTTTPVLAIGGSSSIGPGTMTWDPARKGIVLMLSLDSAVAPSLMLLRGDGTLEDLTGPIGQHYSLSPGKNGRIYCWSIGQIRYVEPDGSEHLLQDAATGMPFEHSPVFALQSDLMTYHAPTNSLYTALLRGSPHPCNGGTGGIIVSRLPLTQDGTAVAGPVTCSLLTMPPEGLGGFPVAWVPLPSGKPGLVTSGSLFTSASAPRIFQIDPATLDAQTFASPGGYVGSASSTAGAWSWAEKKVVVLDPVNALLRSFGQGASGGGALRPVALTMSNQYGSMIEVPPRKIVLEKGVLGHLDGLLPGSGEAALAGESDASGAFALRLEGAAPQAVAHVRAVWGPRGGTRSAILDPGALLAVPAGAGDLWSALEPRLAALGALDAGELRLQALVQDGARALLTNELLLELGERQRPDAGR